MQHALERMEAGDDLPFIYAADADYAPLEKHRKLAEDVSHIRQGQRQVAEQNAYRSEMTFVQANGDLRRARWWSLASYMMCSLTALAAVLFTIQPSLLQRWRAIFITLVTLGVCLVLLGLKRDGQYALNSWTRLRFKGPVVTH
jgi:Flp pilus assembly protein TadB